MPQDYSKWSYDRILKLLDNNSTKSGTFNQSSFKTDIGQRVQGGQVLTRSQIGGKSLGGGFCAGVCMDWARRILLSPSSRASSFLTHGYDAMPGGKRPG